MLRVAEQPIDRNRGTGAIRQGCGLVVRMGLWGPRGRGGECVQASVRQLEWSTRGGFPPDDPQRGRRALALAGAASAPGRAEVGCLSSRSDLPGDDRRTLQAIKGGDARALASLYRRHGRAVLALCRRILGDADEAEEAALDSFAQIWERSDRYDPSRASPLTYMMTIARSRAIDRLRARRRGQLPVDWTDEVLPTLDPASASALDAALETERREQVQAALRALDERERRAIELSFYEGMSHREIAERLALPLGTVKTRIRQGLIRLRRLVQRERGLT